MTKRKLFRSLICLGALALTGLASVAQTSSDGAIAINGGRETILLRLPSASFVPATPATEKLVTIYSNLGSGQKVYNAVAGSGILGKIGQPWPQWVACGFRPKADHTVTEIRVGVTH